MRILTIVLSALLAVAIFGCRSGAVKSNYETVAVDPQRDTAAARIANQKGAEALQAGNLPAAEMNLKAALVADASFGPAHNNLGVVYFRQKEFYLAAWEFEYAGKLMPDKAEPLNNLGLVYESVGRMDDAVKAYEASLKLSPDSVEIAANLARSYVQQNRTDSRTRELLGTVALKDSRPEWAAWASLQLATMPSTPSLTPPPSLPQPQP